MSESKSFPHINKPGFSVNYSTEVRKFQWKDSIVLTIPEFLKDWEKAKELKNTETVFQVIEFAEVLDQNGRQIQVQKKITQYHISNGEVITLEGETEVLPEHLMPRKL
jgi:hypothetical protein